jgi:hypothetical protein
MQIHVLLYYKGFGIKLLIFMIFNAHYVESMHFGNILNQKKVLWVLNKFFI